jgi:hypothetical protein
MDFGLELTEPPLTTAQNAKRLPPGQTGGAKIGRTAAYWSFAKVA